MLCLTFPHRDPIDKGGNKNGSDHINIIKF